MLRSELKIQENRNIQLFKQALLKEVASRVSTNSAVNSDFSDYQLEKLAFDVGARLTLKQIQDTVRRTQKEILETFKLMLVRRKNFGYVIPEPKEQQAIGEETKSIRNRLKKKANILYGVNDKDYTADEKNKLVYSRSATSAMLNLSKHVTSKALLKAKVTKFDADQLSAVFFNKFQKQLKETND